MKDKKKKQPFIWRIFKWILLAVLAIVIFFIIFYIFANKIILGPHNIKIVKGNHSKIVKFIEDEISKCQLGQNKFMSNQVCPATPKKVIEGTLFAGLSDKSKYPSILVLYNPYNDYDAAIRTFKINNDDKFLGYTGLSISGSNIVIKTCHKAPCQKEENRLQDSIEVQ